MNSKRKGLSRFMFVALPLATAVFMGGSAALADSEAGLFLEPGLQYMTGTGSFNAPVFSSDTQTSGLGFDLKAGFHLAEIFFAGLDGSYGKPHYQTTDGNYSADATLSQLGVVVGAQMPIVGLRVWGDYILSSVYDPAATSNGTDIRFHDGTGFKLGAGFRVLMFSLNLEYEDVTYNGADIQAIGPVTTSYSSNNVGLHDKRWIASASFPLEL